MGYMIENTTSNPTGEQVSWQDMKGVKHTATIGDFINDGTTSKIFGLVEVDPDTYKQEFVIKIPRDKSASDKIQEEIKIIYKIAEELENKGKPRVLPLF